MSPPFTTGHVCLGTEPEDGGGGGGFGVEPVGGFGVVSVLGQFFLRCTQTEQPRAAPVFVAFLFVLFAPGHLWFCICRQRLAQVAQPASAPALVLA